MDSKLYSVVKSDLDNIFELDIIIKQNCTAQYWRDLESRAKEKNIYKDCGCTPNGLCYFDTTKGKRYLLIPND